MKSHLHYIILAVIVISFYGNTLANGFVHDDVWQVQKRSIFQVFKSCIAEEIVGGCQRGFYWRPMQYLSYYMTFFVSSKPWVFHLVNLIYFWMAAVLVYMFSLEIIAGSSVHHFKKRSTQSNSNLRPSNSISLGVSLANISRLSSNRGTRARSTTFLKWLPSLPLLAATIFAIHPVNSEVVNWVSATPELLSTIFGLLTLLFYLKRVYFFSALFFFLALLSKETSVVVLPLIIVSADLLLVKGDHISPLKRLATFVIPLVAYLFFRNAVLGRVIYKYEGYYELTLLDQIYTNLALLPRYLLKLVWPLPLSFQQLVEPTRNFTWQVALGAGGLVMILVVLGVLWGRRERLLVFSLILFFAGILPALLFINKIGQFLFSERYLFFSTIGLGMVVAGIAGMIMAKQGTRRVIKAVILTLGIILLLGSWFVVVQRNRDWKDNVASYKAMIGVDGRNWNAHLGLGRQYLANSDFDLAKQEFRQVLALDAQNIEAKNELMFLENLFEFDGTYSFNYPNGWKTSRQKDQVIVTDGNINVEITTDAKKRTQTFDQYLATQEPYQANLVNQGLAQIPSVDLAWVRIYDLKLEFFLFKGERVVRVVASGIDSKHAQNDFNRILGSIKIAISQ